MYRTTRSNGTGFTLGVIMSGAVVGAGLALLFAPKAGSALRSDISGSVDSLRTAIANRYQALAARAGVELDNLHDTVDTATDAIESRATAAVQTAARRVRAVNADAQAAHSNSADA
ncbi:MAG: YtxH domain-containing protein [Vicinamibacterales bacterium]